MLYTATLAIWLYATCAAAAPNSRALPQLTSSLGPVVNLGFAAFAGNDTTTTGEPHGPVTFFGGIPYAQPPLENLRFRGPQMLDESIKNGGHVSVTDARNWGPPCIPEPTQVGIGSEGTFLYRLERHADIDQGTDCLFLNVWKPTDAKEGDKLPVVVYIYVRLDSILLEKNYLTYSRRVEDFMLGLVFYLSEIGTRLKSFFLQNTQAFPLYDWVNQSDRKIIAVSVGYRLNVLGFLSGKELQVDGDANAGVLDQRAAIEWVQRNVARFGGDPDTITIDGESAGGASIVMQVVAYGGKAASSLSPLTGVN